MKHKVLVDTGPLVALLNARDCRHAWCKDRMAVIRPPLLTCEAVLSETAFLVRRVEGGSDLLLEFAAKGLIQVAFQVEPEINAIRRLMRRYANVPMSLADACLVRMAEQIPQSEVLTFDSDFCVYRKHGRQVIPLIMP